MIKSDKNFKPGEGFVLEKSGQDLRNRERPKEPKNPNYCATIVQIGPTYPLDGLDNLVGTRIYGNQVLTSKDVSTGDIGLFFPLETALSKEFLSANNLYRAKVQTKELHNKDENASGFFELHGRIRCVKFKGHRSEGFYIPLRSLFNLIPTVSTNLDGQLSELGLQIGSTFDEINGIEICHKYISRKNRVGTPKLQTRTEKLADSIVPNQFRFHPDTEQLRRHISEILPSQTISISDKAHGTSVIIGKPLTIRKLNWFENLLKKFGVKIQDTAPGFVYSSRKVIKSVDGVEKASNHYYTSDIWGDVAKEIRDQIPNGYTVYGEIVGYTKDGSPIQGGYDYGCAPGQHTFLIYRVTVTNPDGLPLELSWPQLIHFCDLYGFKMVSTFYYGKAGDLYPLQTGQTIQQWQEDFLKYLEENFVEGRKCISSNGKVPAEGIVVRQDYLHHSKALKLKSFEFLSRETKLLDKGESNIEDEQSEESDEHSEVPSV